MGDDRNGLDLEQDDSLPWLEPVDDYDDEPGVSPLRLVGLVIAGLGIIALALGGFYWLQQNPRGGEGELITAEAGDYKVVPEEPDARSFDGEGDSSYAASEGVEPDGRIDASRAPEAPAIGVPAPDKAPAAAPAQNPDRPVASPEAAARGAVVVQLGAFASRKSADTAWSSLGRRIAALRDYAPSVSSATVGGGTVYRLRTSARSNAAADRLCAAVKAKGENCIVIR